MKVEIKKLVDLCGLKVNDISLEEEDAGILFENGASLSIYNKFIFEKSLVAEENKIINKRLKFVSEENNYIIFEFEDSIFIKIDMNDDGYKGPEALQLRIPDEPIIIWN